MENKSPGEEVTLGSGIVVTVTAFPPGLYREINIKGMRDFPDPVPPKKTIKVVDGTETVDDLDDPTFLKARNEASLARASVLGEAVLDFCVHLDLSQYESEIKRMEKYSDPFPSDPDERRVAFLGRYALRGAADHKAVTESALFQMMVTDKDVAERLRFFRRKMARPADGNLDAPGSIEDQRVDIPESVQGTRDDAKMEPDAGGVGQSTEG